MIMDEPICVYCLNSWFGCEGEDNERTICDSYIPRCEHYEYGCEGRCDKCEGFEGTRERNEVSVKEKETICAATGLPCSKCQPICELRLEDDGK